MPYTQSKIITQKKDQINRYYKRIKKIESEIYPLVLNSINKLYPKLSLFKRYYFEDGGDFIIDEKNIPSIDWEDESIIPLEVSAHFMDGYNAVQNYWLDTGLNAPEDFPRYIIIYLKEEKRIKKVDEISL